MDEWMSGEHEKGSHEDGGGEGYLKYLDGSLRDEMRQIKEGQRRLILKDRLSISSRTGPQGLAPRWSLPSAADGQPQPGRWKPRAASCQDR